MSNRASVQTVAEALKKSLPEAQLIRIPRHPERRNIVLAILCLGLQRRYPYKENEFNDYLKSALAEFNSRVDHVTCRRYMVDLGFVKRDRAGIRYFLNFPKVESTLSEEAMASARDLVEQALAHRRRRSRDTRAPRAP